LTTASSQTFSIDRLQPVLPGHRRFSRRPDLGDGLVPVANGDTRAA
jgi:hypothetical protein